MTPARFHRITRRLHVASDYLCAATAGATGALVLLTALTALARMVTA